MCIYIFYIIDQKRLYEKELNNEHIRKKWTPKKALVKHRSVIDFCLNFTSKQHGTTFCSNRRPRGLSIELSVIQHRVT